MLRVRTNARDEVAGALAVEVSEREPLQVLEGFPPHAAGHMLGDARYHEGFPPVQRPGQQGGQRQFADENVNLMHLHQFSLALQRDEHIIHPRHGQPGCDHLRAGARHRQRQSEEEQAVPRSGKAKQA